MGKLYINQNMLNKKNIDDDFIEKVKNGKWKENYQ